MDVAFIQHAQHDVNGDQRGQNQHRLVRQRNLESLRRALKFRLDAGGHVNLSLDLVDRLHGVAQAMRPAPG